MNGFFEILAGILQVGAFFPYIFSILYRGAKPIQATWINYALLDTVLFVGMCLEGVFNWQMFGIVLGVWIILILSFVYGVKKWGCLERFCLSAIPMGVIFSIGFASPIWAMGINLLLIFTASIPTFLSGWKNSKRESLLAWAISSIACTIILITGKQDFMNLAQPIVFLIINGTMTIILVVSKYKARPSVIKTI